MTVYFEALATRDAKLLDEVVAPDLFIFAERLQGSDGGPPVVRSQIVSGAYAPPSRFEIADVTIDGDDAVVEVWYTIASSATRAYPASLRLRRDSAARAGWFLVDPFGTIGRQELFDAAQEAAFDAASQLPPVDPMSVIGLCPEEVLCDHMLSGFWLGHWVHEQFTLLPGRHEFTFYSDLPGPRSWQMEVMAPIGQDAEILDP